MTTKEIISALERGARANRNDPCRQGNLIHISGPGAVIMTGDLHGCTPNFEKLCRFARLDANPDRHLILHELLHYHGDQTEPDQCHSYQLVAQAAVLKARFPNQVHILLGNHAMAQVTRDEILKNGKPMVRALNTGLYAAFTENAGPIMQALDEYIMSLPIAVRTDNRIWLSHSLPSKRHLTAFDNDIFEKRLLLDDMRSNPSLHALVWDRAHTDALLEELSEMWNAETFIVGHQPQANGRKHPHPRLIILASDHGHGCYLMFDLNRRYEHDELFDLTRPIASIE